MRRWRPRQCGSPPQRMWRRRRNWLACSRRAHPSRATCRPVAISPTRGTKTSSRARLPLARPLADAGTRSVGATVRLAVESTRRWTSSNTNLGIVLLLTPLARAALGLDRFSIRRRAEALASADTRTLKRALYGETQTAPGATPASSPESQAASPEEEFSASGLRAALRQVLDATTIEDARDVYAAIRLASPGGLGQADSQDVAKRAGCDACSQPCGWRRTAMALHGSTPQRSR